MKHLVGEKSSMCIIYRFYTTICTTDVKKFNRSIRRDTLPQNLDCPSSILNSEAAQITGDFLRLLINIHEPDPLAITRNLINRNPCKFAIKYPSESVHYLHSKCPRICKCRTTLSLGLQKKIIECKLKFVINSPLNRFIQFSPFPAFAQLCSISSFAITWIVNYF